jgi:hypothetical protein
MNKEAVHLDNLIPRRVYMTAALSLSALMVGCAHGIRQYEEGRFMPGSGNTTPEQVLAKPRSLRDVVKNMKAIFDNDLLWHSSFFSDNTLKIASGADKMRIATLSEHIVTASAIGPDDFETISLISGLHWKNLYPSMVWDATRDLSPSTKPWVTCQIWFTFTDNSLTFDVVTAIWGPGWVRVFGPPSPHRTLPSPTSPHGNWSIRYTDFHGSRNRRVTLDFDHAGFLQNLDIQDREQ